MKSQQLSGAPREQLSVSCDKLNHSGAGVVPLSGSGLGFLLVLPCSTQLQLPFRLPSCSMEWVFPWDLYLHVALFRFLLYQGFVAVKSGINVFVFAKAAKVQVEQNIRSFSSGECPGLLFRQKEVKCGQE